METHSVASWMETHSVESRMETESTTSQMAMVQHSIDFQTELKTQRPLGTSHLEIVMAQKSSAGVCGQQQHFQVKANADCAGKRASGQCTLPRCLSALCNMLRCNSPRRL